MTITEMREALGLGPEYSDAYVVDAYVQAISPAGAAPSSSEPPITLLAAKQQLGVVDFDDDDALIASLLASATARVERETGIVLSRRVIVETADSLADRLALIAWPIVGVDAITYLDSDGVEQLLDPSLYRLTARRMVRIIRAGASSWPTSRCERDAVTIVATAGYAGPEDVPADLVHAIKLLLAEFYLNREAGSISKAAQDTLNWLLEGFKVRLV